MYDTTLDHSDDTDRPVPGVDVPTHEYHGARAALYSALAGVFCYPAEETLAELTAPETRHGIDDAGRTLGLEREAGALRDALSAEDPETLRATYTETFGLPGEDGEYPVVPYEAHYTVRGDIGQKQRRIAKVVGAVEALGFTVAETFDERQDHVALELELLQLLAGWRAVAARTGDLDDAESVERIEATLLEEHLVDFVPSLATAVREATDEPVYVAGADLAEELVVADHRRRGGNGGGP
jgi:TorA-specific chaperone